MRPSTEQFQTDLRKNTLTDVQTNFPLSKICTFRIGGEARLVLTPKSTDELITCIQNLRRYEIPHLTVGSASNLLFDDKGFDGAVIRTHKLKTVTVREGILTAEAGVLLPYLCRIAAENSMGGLHGLCGIPGTVGGSTVTAAGAFGCNIYDRITEIEVYFPNENQIKTLPLTASDFSYRKSPEILKDAVILRVSFLLPHRERHAIEAEMISVTEKRRATQPCNSYSAGSYFKRPENAPPAAFLIDQAGLKGTRIGDATVSKKHAGFIVNEGKATSQDVKTLAKKVKNEIFRAYGVTLTEEVETVPYQII